MQVSEWRTIVDEVQSLWGPTRKWSAAADMYGYVRHVPASSVRSTVESMFLEGRATAPSPSEVIGHTRRATGSGDVTGEEIADFCTVNGHAYGIVVDEPTRRVGVCRRCRHEWDTVPHLLTTEAEREAGEVWKPDDLTDRIAP